MRCSLGNTLEGNIKAKGLKSRLLLCRGNKTICNFFYSCFDVSYLLDINQFQRVGTAVHVDRDILLVLPAFF